MLPSCLLAFVPPCLLLFGCGYRAPAVSLQEVSITGAGDDAVALGFVMELTNPNELALELDQFRYSLSIDGAFVYEGRRAAEVALGPAEKRTMTLPAVIPYGTVGWTPGELPPQARFELSGRLQYRAPNQLTQILFDTGVARPKVGFSGQGTVRFR